MDGEITGMKPSGKFQGFATSTPEHDMLQLWVSQAENQKRIAEVFRDKIETKTYVETVVGENNRQTYYNSVTDQISKKWPCEKTKETTQVTLEKPIYSGTNNFLVGIADGLLHIESQYHCDYEYLKHEKTTLEKKSENYLDVFMILYEIKPQLKSISQAIGQITTYSDFLKYARYSDTASHHNNYIIMLYEDPDYKQNPYSSTLRKVKPAMLIITLEESTKFDNMLLQQGIRVLHVKESELIK